jgi:hypothetical protein
MDKATKPMDEEMARRQRAASAEQAPGGPVFTADSPRSEVHTYADGSQRVGIPPFPDKSPLEETTELKRVEAAQGMAIPQGMPTSGERPPSPQSGITEEEFKAKAEQQLNSDLQSGKTPEVVNPTTASTKPELAGTDGHVGETDAIGDNLTADDIKTIAGQIQPAGNLEATDEERQAAVVQVEREVGVPITKGDAAKKPVGRPPTKK